MYNPTLAFNSVFFLFTVCKLVTKELNERLEKTDSSDVIETGYSMDSKKKITKYNKS